MTLRKTAVVCFLIASTGSTIWASPSDTIGYTHRGETLDPATYGPGVIETMAEVLERDAAAPAQWMAEPASRDGLSGNWLVPTMGAMTAPNSGNRHVTNQWGDTSMGIGFPDVVDVHGAYFAGQASKGAWTTGVRGIGYRDGVEVKRTKWFAEIGAEPVWIELDLCGVDRVVIESQPVANGGGWYAMDDLTFTVADDGGQGPVTIGFEDVNYKTSLTGSGYAGLTWEAGDGDIHRNLTQEVHHPAIPPGVEDDSDTRQGADPVQSRGTGTLPEYILDFEGAYRGESGSFSYPPDTHGAVGTTQVIATVNRIFNVYDKITGQKLLGTHLNSFLPGSNGDPRVLFDQHSGRWVVIVSDFSARVYLAVSASDDATGAWYKTSFLTSQGSDAGNWPDYPTLGVDENGIYVAAYMVGGGRMTLFAINKAPLVGHPQVMGTVTAFRSLPWEGAIQPVHSFGDSLFEYVVSLQSSSRIRVRRVNPPLSSPTLTELGTISIPQAPSPPDVPSLGSSTPLDSVGNRLMMSVYRDGSIWTAHTISSGGRAAARWYELDPVGMSFLQSGTVDDPTLHYFFPSIMVDADGHAVMGFTGCHGGQYAGMYYTGRHRTDPPGEMAPPVQLKAGQGAQNNLDSYGRNRWGDYSFTSVDPTDDRTIYTIQEYAKSTNIWGTWVGAFRYGDCNGNGVADEDDIVNGTSQDLNGTGVPDECEVASPVHSLSPKRNRYISFVPENTDLMVAFQVQMTAGPGSLGVVGWVGEPLELGCPGACSGEYAARVVDLPVYRVWSEPVVNISDCEIVPVAEYELRATGDGVMFSDPITLPTIDQPGTKFWGDVAGQNIASFWDGPDGTVNIGDAQAAILVFQGDANAPPRTWTDLGPQETNLVTNIDDVFYIIMGFKGEPYPWVDPDQCP